MIKRFINKVGFIGNILQHKLSGSTISLFSCSLELVQRRRKEREISLTIPFPPSHHLELPLAFFVYLSDFILAHYLLFS